MKEKFIFQILTQCINYIFSIVASYIVTLTLEVYLFGILAFANSIIGLFALFISIGFNLIYNQYNSQENFNQYFSIYFFFNTILVIANLGPLYIIILFFDFGVDPSLLLILLICGTISSLSSPFSTHLYSKMKVFKRQLPIFLLNISELTLKILIVLNIALFPDPLIAIVVNTLFFTVLRTISILLFSRGEYKFEKLNPVLMRQFLKDTRPIILVSIFSTIYSNLKLIIINLSFGFETLGYYNFVENVLLNALLMISGTLKPLYFSVFSTKLSKDKKTDITKMANLIEKYSSIVFMFICIFIFLNADIFLELLLPKYLPSLVYVYISIFSSYFASVNRPYASLIIPGKKQKFYFKYHTLKLSILLILMILIVPNEFFSMRMLGLGAFGLSILQISTWIVEFFIYRYLVIKFFNIHYYRRIFLHIFIGFNTLLFTFMIRELFLQNIMHDLVFLFLITSIIMFGLYMSEMVLFKEIRKKDVRYILSIFNLKTYIDSYKKEKSSK